MTFLGQELAGVGSCRVLVVGEFELSFYDSMVTERHLMLDEYHGEH